MLFLWCGLSHIYRFILVTLRAVGFSVALFYSKNIQKKVLDIQKNDYLCRRKS